jgi:ATP-dependent Clp endopeptidase proteolytic subunit ClpP
LKDVQWLNSTSSVKPLNNEEESNNQVSTLDNRIFFYSGVTTANVLIFNKEIRNLNVKILSSATALSNKPANLYIHINSYGGSVFAGLAAMDYIRTSTVPVCSVVEGCAASAATLMSIVAKERRMHEHSFMLIHQLSSGMWGKYEELKDEMKNCDVLMKTIKKIYIEHAKIPKNKLNQILKHDLWFDAKTCLNYGLVDEII